MARIAEIEGIGRIYSKKLISVGVNTVDDLLQKCKDKSGRKSFSSETGIDEGKLLEWTNMADLFRIKGISSQYAELLVAAGVDTVKELRHRNADNLLQKMREINSKRKLVRQMASLNRIKSFIEQAKSLDPIISH